MIVKLHVLTEHLLDFLSLKGGCRGLSESILVKMSNCWKSHAAAQIIIKILWHTEKSGLVPLVYYYMGRPVYIESRVCVVKGAVMCSFEY